MKIKYEFITGEKMEVEVEDTIGELVIEMEVIQSQRNRTETRRHYSLESMQEGMGEQASKQFIDKKADVEQLVIQLDEKERLHEAIGKLEAKDAFIIRKYYFQNKTMMDIGQEMGVSAMAVSKRLKKIPDKLKKFMN